MICDESQLFIYFKGHRVRWGVRRLSQSTGSLLHFTKCPQELKMGQSKARSAGLHPGFSGVCQFEPSHAASQDGYEKEAEVGCGPRT